MSSKLYIFQLIYTFLRASFHRGFSKTKATSLRKWQRLLDQWSWRESNPRPGKATICFLHAYPALIVGSD